MNDWLQLHAGLLRDFDGNVEMKVCADWAVLMSHMRELGARSAGMSYLEIGTGWFPTLPVCFSLAGAASCRTYDISRHLDEGLTFRMMRSLEQHLPAIAAAGNRPLEEVDEEYRTLLRCPNLGALLDQARIEYFAPADATCTSLPDACVDVVFSNSVLEHVPPEVIQKLMAESRRVLRPGGFSIHSANCGDHYAYFDSKITPINYLAYPERRWRFWNNPLHYQNRLRPRDFLQLAEEARLKVVLCKMRQRPDLMPALRSMQVAPEFAGYPPEQLCSTSIDFVAQPQAV